MDITPRLQELHSFQNKQPILSKPAQQVYLALLAEFSLAGAAKTLNIRVGKLIRFTRTSRGTFFSAREELVQLGLIVYEPEYEGGKPVYSLPALATA
jgi:hypothetical protein